MNIISMIIILVPGLLIVSNLFGENHSFMDFGKVVREHLSIFKSHKYQYIVFYVYPLFIAVGIACCYTPDSSFMEQLNVVVSILISALLAIMGVLVGKSFDGLDKEQIKKAVGVLRETNNAIVFDVAIGVFLIVINLILFMVDAYNILWCRLLAGVSYYLLIVMLLNILLIIKRVSRLLYL